MKMKVFLDLDRTLFKTDDFDSQKWQLIGALYGVDGNYENQRQPEFHIHDRDMYAYDFTAHLKDLGLPEKEIYEQIKASNLADGRLEHTGVGDLVNWLKQRFEVSILTYGKSDYKNHKLSLCPRLNEVPAIITLKSKDNYFKDNHLGNCWMVDDRPIGNILPDGVKFIQASLEGQAFDETRGWPIIYALDDIQDIIV